MHQLDEEADHALATYANQYPNTYILSHDSDALIVPCAGVIHINPTMDEKVSLKVFRQKNVLDYLGLETTDQLIIFACFVGNDITRQIPKKLQTAISNSMSHGHYFRKVCALIRENHSDNLVECINKCISKLVKLTAKEKKPLLDAIKHYKFQCIRTTDTIERSLETGWCSEELLRAVQTKSHTFPIIPYDLGTDSPWIMSRPLRKVLYAVLGITDIEETVLLEIDETDVSVVEADHQYVNKDYSLLTILSAAEKQEYTEVPAWWNEVSPDEAAIELTLRAIEAHGGYSMTSNIARSIRWAFKSVGGNGIVTPKVDSCTNYSIFLVFWIHLQTLHYLTMADIKWPALPNGSDVNKALSQTLLESFFNS